VKRWRRRILAVAYIGGGAGGLGFYKELFICSMLPLYVLTIFIIALHKNGLKDGRKP
jgi:hypothetical protein